MTLTGEPWEERVPAASGPGDRVLRRRLSGEMNYHNPARQRAEPPVHRLVEWRAEKAARV